MMGHRGCRLDITYPEIAIMQTKAIIEAALNVKKEGIEVKPEIMIPLICDIKELKYVKDIVVKTANEIINEYNTELKYHIGTMIEIPRAALLADEIAKEAEFFSFGTNDLTQLSYGFSRDDASKYLNDYYKKNIFDFDPFEKIDQHAGDTNSIEFCNRVGLTYVSCSPYRVPVARLAAAHAQIKLMNMCKE